MDFNELAVFTDLITVEGGSDGGGVVAVKVEGGSDGGGRRRRVAGDWEEKAGYKPRTAGRLVGRQAGRQAGRQPGEHDAPNIYRRHPPRRLREHCCEGLHGRPRLVAANNQAIKKKKKGTTGTYGGAGPDV